MKIDKSFIEKEQFPIDKPQRPTLTYGDFLQAEIYKGPHKYFDPKLKETMVWFLVKPSIDIVQKFNITPEKLNKEEPRGFLKVRYPARYLFGEAIADPSIGSIGIYCDFFGDTNTPLGLRDRENLEKIKFITKVDSTHRLMAAYAMQLALQSTTGSQIVLRKLREMQKEAIKGGRPNELGQESGQDSLGPEE